MEELFRHLKPFLVTMTLCSPRLLAAFLISPFFNTDMITGATRNCIVMVFVLIVFPTVLPIVRSNELALGLIFATIAKEAAVGALIGYLASLFFHAIGAVGQILDYQRGASFASVIDPATGVDISPMGSFFTQAAIVVFFTSGGFTLFLSGMYESYSLWPILSYWPRFDPGFMEFFLRSIDQMTALSLVLASPVLIALFFSELGLALMNRFAPQLNVFFLSMPVKSAMALLLMIIYMEFFLKFIRDEFLLRWHFFDMLRQVVR